MKTKTRVVFRLATGVLALNLMVLGLVGYSLHRSKAQYEDRAKLTTVNLTRSLEFSISGILQKVDLALSTEQDEVERELAAGGISEGRINAHVARMLGRIPEIVNLRLTDAKGDIRYGIESPAGKVVNVADRDYFTTLRDRPNSGMFLSKPLFGRVSRQWIMIAARRVNHPDGSFAGVIHGNIPIEYFRKHFSTFTLGKNDVMTLRDKDLAIVVRYPEGEKGVPGASSISKTFAALIRAGKPVGSYQAVSGVDSVVRIFTYRKVGSYPLYVNCGLALQDYLVAWHDEAEKMLLQSALFFCCTLVGSWFLFRSWEQERLALQQVDAAREKLEIRVAERTVELQRLNEELQDQASELEAEMEERQSAQQNLQEQTILLEHEVARRQSAQEALALQQRQLEAVNLSLEEKISVAVSELRQKDQALIVQSRQASMGEMIGNIAHQWRQPLNALCLLLANIKDAYYFRELDQRYLEQLIAEGNLLIQKMSTTITDFRNFFHKDKERQPFSARKQIDDAISLVESSFGHGNIEIRVHAAIDLELFGFPNEYSQVLLNLLSNAKEAIEGAGVEDGVIEIGLEVHDGKGCVTVRDNGGGIPESSRERIFEPYFSTKQMGTGIGLYMSKMIIERNMGGSIGAVNTANGAQFTIVTPLAAEIREQGAIEECGNGVTGSVGAQG